MEAGERVSTIESVFQEYSFIKITSPFKADVKTGLVFGEIVVSIDGFNLEFLIQVELNYPYKSSVGVDTLHFFFSSETGLPHQNDNNSICVHTASSPDLVEKLRLDIAGLKEWIEKYYIRREKDEHQDYVLVPYSNYFFPPTTVYYTEISKEIKKGEFGFLEYSLIYHDKTFPKSGATFCIRNFRVGGKQYDSTISSLYLKNGTANTGAWIFIGDEPTRVNRKVVANWNKLGIHLNPSQINFLANLTEKHKQHFKDKTEIFCMLGYYTSDGKPHWELIKIPVNKNPAPLKFTEAKFTGGLNNQEILWGRGVNISYDRFFGRGKLCDRITDSGVHIIGCGAIGSQLSEMMVRGGLKQIRLWDADLVEAENVCRSQYHFMQTVTYKTLALQQILFSVSPFIEIHPENKRPQFEKYSVDTAQFQIVKQDVEKSEIIFNCTADDEVTYLLDEMNLTKPVYDISISNEAKGLVCVTGKNLFEKKVQAFKEFEGYEKNLYQPVGCFSATFRASYNDINTLLSYAVKHINSRLEKGLEVDSFRLKVIENETGFSIDYKEI